MLYIKPRSESGMAMFTVMIVSFVSSILITSYMGFAIQESRHSIWQKEKAQSLYLAEAGIQKGIYYLNESGNADNPWASYIDNYNGTLLVNEDQVPSYTGYDIDDSNDAYVESYTISLHKRFVDENGAIITLPPRFFLIRSTGIIKRTIPIKHSVSAIVSRMSGVLAPGALSIYDSSDPEDELVQFQSSQWVISGIDIDDPFGQTGVAGIAIANTGDNVKEDGGQLDLPGLPTRIDQVSGIDADGNLVQGADAIIEDENMPKDLSELVGYFKPMSTDISGIGKLSGSLLGAPDDYQILYADLSQGDLTLPGNTTGYGILILENDGVFQMDGNSQWNGIILCHGGASIYMRGGGNTAAHIYGSLMIDDGTITTNGTADIRYSSLALGSLDKQLVVYQVFSWCGGWGKHLGRFGKEAYSL